MLKTPDKDSSSKSNLNSTAFPVPIQLFSLIPKAIAPPDVPTPAPALISPVGLSSTSISIIFKFFSSLSVILYLTSLKIFLALIFDIDFSKFIIVKGSPSSTISSLLITSSLVTVFPLIFILSTNSFSPSKILKVISIESFLICSCTLCSTNCKLLFEIIKSISSKISLILNGE